MKYNSKKMYNLRIKDGGCSYNNLSYIFTVYLYEVLNTKETALKTAAALAISENLNVKDFVEYYALYNYSESFTVEESLKHYALFDLVEKLNVNDTFYKVLVSLYLNDKLSAIDELKAIEALIKQEEPFKLNEQMNLKALIKYAEKFNLTEAKEIFAFIEKFESLPFDDKNPKKAISDFIIGKSDDLDTAYDWIIPFDMKINWAQSTIQVMPQAESDYIDMPNVDGSMATNTVYKNRLFNIVAYSELGLSVYEKEMLKKQIAEILDSTKNKTKKLTMQATGTSFDAKYSGTLSVSEGATFVKATIPFETSPYGYPLFDKEVYGTGLLQNSGIADVGCVNRISAGAVNPSFQMGSVTYSWNGTVPNDYTLVIDHESLICYLEDVRGNRQNAIDKLTGEFQKIPANSSVSITAIGNTGNYLVTTLKEKILW